MNDGRGRKCVAQLVENVGENSLSDGGLDKDSGMLVFTNDGDLQTGYARKTMFTRFTE